MSSEYDLSVSDSPVSPPALVRVSGSVGFGARAQLFYCSPGSPRPGRHCARFPDGQALRAAGCFAPGLSPLTQVLRGKKEVWEQPRAPGIQELIDDSVYSVLSGWPQPVHPSLQSQLPLIWAHPGHQASHLHSTSVQGTLTSLVQHAGRQGKGVSLPSCPETARSHG